jgi:phytanoyl-CoA hydroxylase
MMRTRTNEMTLKPEQVAQYREDGFLIVQNLLSPEEVEALGQRIDDACAGRVEFPDTDMEWEPGAPRTRDMKYIRKINNGVFHDEVFRSLAAHPQILDVAEAMIGPDIKLFGDQLFIKPPGGIEKTYHQDSPYFKIEPMSLVSGWIAVDDVTEENGCLRAIAGSHKLGPQPHSDAWMVGSRRDMKIPDRLIDRSRERLIEMKAGSVSFHHSLLMHASGPNRSSRFRRGYAFHYMTAQSRWTGHPSEKPQYVLLRGREYPGCV